MWLPWWLRWFGSWAGWQVRRPAAGLAAALLTQGVAAVGAEPVLVQADGVRYVVIKVDPAKARLRLFLKDPAGKPFNRFDALERHLAKEGRRLRWAMNAGMYHGSFAPVGLCVIDGKEVAPLNLGSDEGNFFLKPNGVFAVAGGRAFVLETEAI